MSTSSAPSTSSSVSLSPPSAAAAAAAAAASSTPYHEALFLSSLTTKPSHPFAYRRSFLSPPLLKRSTANDGSSEQANKENADGAVDVLRFGRHHPRRAELQGEWEEELIAQMQKEEEDKDSDKPTRASSDDVKQEKDESSPTATDDSSSSLITSHVSTTVAVPSSSFADSSFSSSSSSPSQAPFSPGPTTPLSAADASLSSVLHLLAADKQPTLPQRICNLLTAAISFHATLMQTLYLTCAAPTTAAAH